MTSNVRSRYAPFNWASATSFLLVFSGAVFLWVHFSGIIPVIEEGNNLPFHVLIPLHLWALAHLLMVTLIPLLGVLALFYPGVARSHITTPVSWKRYRRVLGWVVGSAALCFLLSTFLSFDLAAMVMVELAPLSLLVGWNANLIRRLHNSVP